MVRKPCLAVRCEPKRGDDFGKRHRPEKTVRGLSAYPVSMTTRRFRLLHKAIRAAVLVVILCFSFSSAAAGGQGVQQDARIQRLFSKDAATRSAAKADLLQHPDTALLPALLKELPASQGTNRDDLLEVLAKYDDARKIPVFLAMHPWSSNVADVGQIEQQLANLGQPAADALVRNCTETDDNYADWAAGVLSWMHQVGTRILVAAVQNDDGCKHEMGTRGLMYMSDVDSDSRAETQMAADAAVDTDERIRGAARKWFSTWNGKEEQIDCSGILEALIVAYQANAPSATRVKIAQMLSAVDSPRVTRFMRAAVHSPNAEIQEIAKNYVAGVGAQPATENKAPQTPEEKIKFIREVTETPAEGANGKISPLLNDADANVRTAAATALGDLNAPSTNGEDNPAFDPQTARPPLRKAAKDPLPEVRAAAIGALGDIRSDNDSDLIVSALRDSDASVVLAAENAIGQVPADAAAPALMEIYHNHNNSAEMTEQAVVALRLVCDPNTLPTLVEILQADNKDFYLDAAEGLACVLQKRPDKSAFEPILKVLDAQPQGLGPQNADVIGALMTALAETKNPAAFERLALMAKSQNIWTRRDVAVPLATLGDRRAIPVLSQLLVDPDNHVRSAAAAALTRFSNFPAPPELLATLENLNAPADIYAIQVLVASHDPKAVDALIAAMPKNPGVIYALGEAHDTRAVPALISYMQNPANDAGPRSTAAGSLGKLGDPRAVQPLIASLADDNGQIVMQVSAALGMLKDKRAVAPLQQAMARWSIGQHQNAETVKTWIRQALTQLGAMK